MHVVTLYAKAGCHLCDEARAYLEDALADLSQNSAAPDALERLDLRETDIRTDPALFERYRYRIPVITLDDIERLEGQIAREDVFALLDR